MDYESADSRTKGCWDPAPILTPFCEKWTSATATPDFVVDEVWCGMVGSLGFGTGVTPEVVGYWKNALKDIYKGDEGRKKVRMAVMCLLERDGLLLRLGDIKCPVYWLQVSLKNHSACPLGHNHFLNCLLTRRNRERRTSSSAKRSPSSKSSSSPRLRKPNLPWSRAERII